MDSENSLAISGKKHQISLPMTRSFTGFDLRGALVNRDAMLNGFHGRSAPTSPPAAFALGARQIMTPMIILCACNLGIDETIDRFMTNPDRLCALTQITGDLLW